MRPPPPSEFAGELEPSVDSIILRCLDTDPKARPSSALEVAAALGGGDPLQAVLAAGETPSPELLAAAGGAGTVPLRTAWILLLSVGLVLSGCIALARYSTVVGISGWEKSPELLIESARDIIRAAGPPEAFVDVPSSYQERGPGEVNEELKRRSNGSQVFPHQETADKLQKAYEDNRIR